MIGRVLILTSILFLAACAQQPVSDPVAPFQPIHLTAIGYGATSPYDSYTPGQKRLMAMRASKLDAYRALVEQVYGARITSNSTVAALVAQQDSFRVYVDAYVRGAKVLTVTPLPDGNYETVLELEIGDRFYRDLMQFRGESGAAPVKTTQVQGCSGRGAVGSGCAYGANFYFAE